MRNRVTDFRKNDLSGKMMKHPRRTGLLPFMPGRSTVAFFSTLSLFLILSVLIFSFFPVADVCFDNEEISVLEGPFLLSLRGETFPVDLPTVVNTEASEKYTLSRRLNAETDVGNSVLFYTQESWVSVCLDGKPVYSAVRDDRLPIRVAPGSYWHFFRLPEDYHGKTLFIEIEPQFPQYGKTTPVVYIGTKASFLYMILKQGLFSLLAGLPVLNLGIILVIVSFFVREPNLRKRILRLGLFGVVVSIWGLLENRMTQLFFGNIVYASFVLYFCFFLIPMPVSGLLLTFPSFRAAKEFRILFRLSFAVFLGVHVLRLAGIFYYTQMIFSVHGLLILLLAATVRSFILSLRKKTAAEDDLYIYKAVIMLGFFFLSDIISFYTFSEAKVGNASRIGMLLFILYIGVAAIRQIGQTEISLAKTRLYQDLAFRDVMTGLFNRTAFERYLAGFRKETDSENAETVCVVMLDMNHLKMINDVYGHNEGDEAIKTVSDCLGLSFKRKSDCYRIGGDEFCIVTCGLSEKEVASDCVSLKNLLKEKSKSRPYPLSVSCGFSVVGEEGIEAGLKEADKKMYADKERAKGASV